MTGGKHIFFCGFMGSGKSTHGKKLASILKQPFTDLDDYIQKKENKTIAFIFENEGEERFREIESNSLREIIKQPPQVISLGGGTVCREENLRLLKENGLLIYIQLSAEELAGRLKKSRQKRPLLKNVPESELSLFIANKLKERMPWYNASDIITDGLQLNYLQLHRQILEYKKKNMAL